MIEFMFLAGAFGLGWVLNMIWKEM